MRTNRFFLWIAILSLIAISGNCSAPRPVQEIALTDTLGPQEPDLVPVRKMGADGNYVKGPEGFCRIQGSRLMVSLRNMGRTVSPASITSVVLFSQGEYHRYQMETPSVGADTVDLAVTLPKDACWVRCVFTITVDSDDRIFEGVGEKNNRVDGLCMG